MPGYKATEQKNISEYRSRVKTLNKAKPFELAK